MASKALTKCFCCVPLGLNWLTLKNCSFRLAKFSKEIAPKPQQLAVVKQQLGLRVANLQLICCFVGLKSVKITVHRLYNSGS
jgi:hypothetical protein